MKKATAEWVRKAEADYRLAAKLGRGSDPFHDQLCFHCQQASEKYLKALLEEGSTVIPRTHILRDLLALLLPHHKSLRPLQRGLKFLTRFAVGTRYPGQTATKRQARAALRWAKRVRTACRALLGIPPRRAQRKKSP
jgi:HEPN domain-containing protein